MILYKSLMLLLIILSASGCITKFMPEIDESRELLVVEGMITDQLETNRIRLTKSSSIDKKNLVKPVAGCIVSISDDLDNSWLLKESGNGNYITDSLNFRGVVGRKYTLRVNSNGKFPNNYTYESIPMELKPVPEIDNLYWERILIEAETEQRTAKEGCRILIDTHDDSNKCNYYRWDYTETWEIRLPYDVPNKICWTSNKSSQIIIKNTSLLSANSISRFLLNFVSDKTDRLEDKYSLLVNQYSLSEEEFIYWDKMQLMSEQTGTLYDITPSSVQGNIYCNENPSEKVLGYFSVSAKRTRRIFIEESFSGLVNLYINCPVDTIPPWQPIPYLGTSVWVIIDGSMDMPPYKILTDKKGCADCTVRGTTIRPTFWDDDKLNR
ncbi:MAG: hypothetical protein A2X03_05860 [Bacteroidetes bacterium GWA2_40_15]|nr:MAG: hypothetical protein A2X03_05860 [Bacteroidetes bacterium GWA2_40_15]HAM09512.1 hypothetical protein [Bacteroidales bacterium]HBH83882.1 hypothetical protein [Bacteroidales bacterium]HBQ83951.1 hypothetical protein [Bacteroidales bacterium]HCU20289.1 hypothetical protein [Bacteroidales bacterium]